MHYSVLIWHVLDTMHGTLVRHWSQFALVIVRLNLAPPSPSYILCWKIRSLSMFACYRQHLSIPIQTLQKVFASLYCKGWPIWYIIDENVISSLGAQTDEKPDVRLSLVWTKPNLGFCLFSTTCNVYRISRSRTSSAFSCVLWAH